MRLELFYLLDKLIGILEHDVPSGGGFMASGTRSNKSLGEHAQDIGGTYFSIKPSDRKTIEITPAFSDNKRGFLVSGTEDVQNEFLDWKP